MIKKRIMVVVLTVIMSVSAATSAFAMDKKVVEGKYYHRTSGGNRPTYVETYVKEGASDGWYTEDGMWFYMENGVASNKARKLNGIMNYFTQEGRWMDTSSQEYSEYASILRNMREAKISKDNSFSVSGEDTMNGRALSFKMLDDYAETYLYPTDNLEETCFISKSGKLSLDISSKYYNTEDKIRQVLNKLNIPEGSTDEQKVRLIHDFIVSNFDYDFTYNTSGVTNLSEAVANGSKMMCGGYSRLFNKLCNQYGLESVSVLGLAQGQNHMWNKVKVNGEWKYIDVTWDDAMSSNQWYGSATIS